MLAGAPGLATAMPPAKPCNMLVDPTGDTYLLPPVPGVNDEPSLDVVSADLATDVYVLTAVIRLADLSPPYVWLADASYEIQFTVSGSTDRFYLAAHGQYGMSYDAGYRTVAASPAASTPTSMGRPTGRFDPKKDEIRIHAPLALFRSRVVIGPGSVISAVRVIVRRAFHWIVTLPPEAQEPMVADDATSDSSYVFGSPTCVLVGDYCAPRTSGFVGGTAKGEDGYDVNVQVSVALVTSDGVGIGMDGCRNTGYAVTVQLNARTPAEGSPHSSRTTNTWRIADIPANAAYAWIETYPRGSDGQVTLAKYGRSMRRKIGLNRGDVRVTLPVICSKRGRTGSIAGRVVDKAGHAVAADRIVAWSEAPDSQSQILGWGMGEVYDGNKYRVDALASGQNYSVWVSEAGHGTAKYYHVAVTACRATSLRLVVG